MNLLSTINSPADLRRLDIEQLTPLAAEIRETIITTVAENGGHLAANLGVVELTLALHYAFDTPQDKIVWDVGHQCYTHKLLTGRRDTFSSLRQTDGISGFCCRKESVYDVHTTGHASNSVSVALGLAQARELAGEHNNVVAVLGDGALTGGMALEALDHAGDLAQPLIVILNDNEMSITGNVGAISAHLSRIRAGSGYNQAKLEAKRLLERIPWLGSRISSAVSAVKRWIKSLFVPGLLFENLGFTYLGPIDGHNIEEMVSLFRQVQSLTKPVLIHVRTVKGKGYAPAEREPAHWHGAEPFYVATGLPKNGKAQSWTAVFADELTQLGRNDERIIAITAAMEDGTGLTAFKQSFPQRFYDVGIAEQHAVSFAAGLATAGRRPVLAVYSTFLQRAYDQLMEDICLQNLPMVLAIDRAGIIGSDGCSHQGIFDLSYLRSMPGMIILAPADGDELRSMLHYAFNCGKPVALRYPRGAAPTLTHPHPPLQTGRGVLLRDGSDVALFSLGAMTEQALLAADILREQGIFACVADARFAAPLDTDLLISISKRCHGRIVTMEENVSSGGFGEACRAALDNTPHELFSLAIPPGFPQHGDRGLQLNAYNLDGAGAARAITERWFNQ